LIDIVADGGDGGTIQPDQQSVLNLLY